MTDLQLIGPAYGGVFYPEDAVSEYIMALDAFSRDSHDNAAKGIEFCEFLLRQFTAEGELFQENTRAYLGDFHFLAGDPEQGEEILRALITDRPHRSVGYAYLSDALNKDGGAPRALAVLQEALNYPVEDAADYDLPKRIKWLEDELK